jgi:hypothetical protein
MARVWDADAGHEQPVFDDLAYANEMLGLVARHYNDVVAALGPAGGAPFEPLYRRSARWGVAQFCRGFSVGVRLGGADWARLRREHPDWLAAFEGAAPSADDVDATLPRIAAFWRGGTAVGADPWAELRPAFERFRRPFPHAAVQRAMSLRAELAPHFVEVLEAIARDPGVADDPDYMLHHFAIVFLAVWRDKRAFAPMLAIARLPYETVDDLFGDSLFETFGRALAGVCDGNVEPLRAIVADESLSNWVRMTVFDAWALRVIEGDADAAEFEKFLFEFGTHEAERVRREGAGRDDEPDMLDDVVSQVCDLPSPRLVDAVRGWFADELVDESSVDLKFFEAKVACPAAERLAAVRRANKGYPRDVAAEIAWWAGYHEDPPPPRPPPAPTTFVRDGPKIGRNDPCPCGSGRKYKKCHGAN